MHRFNRLSTLWRSIAFSGDLAGGLATFFAAFWIRIRYPIPGTEALLEPEKLDYFEQALLPVLLLRALLLYFFGFYDLPRPRPRVELIRLLLAVEALQALILSGFFFYADRTFPRSVVLLFVALDLLTLLPWRLLLQRGYRPLQRRVALVGCGAGARELAEQIERHHWHGLKLSGFVAAPGDDPSEVDLPGPLLGTVEDLPELERAGRFDDIILADETPEWKTRLIDRLADDRFAPISVLLLPGPFESLIGRMRYRWVRDIPLIDVVNRAEWELNQPLKRLTDLVLGGLLMLLSLPVLAVSAAIVRFGSPGPVFYEQERIGLHRRRFTLLKLRTMHDGAEAKTGEVLATRNDPRLVPMGAALRRYRLDELPQLFNVLAGSMSLVGPRPERPGFVAQYLRDIPGYAERFTLRPGLTGLAQVNGEYHSSPQNKLRYDLAYGANRSLWLDLSILFRTVKIILTSRGV